MTEQQAAPSDRLKTTRRETLIRALFMLLFLVIWNVGEFVLYVVVLVQFGFMLVIGEKSPRLLKFSSQLTTFMRDVGRYLAFNDETRPFPFSDWPATLPEDAPPHAQRQGSDAG